MRIVALLCAVTAALALAAPAATAQQTFETVSGKSYSGKVLADDGTTVEIETAGGATVKVPYETLTPATQYRLKKARTGEDGKSQLELAEWCLGKTLYEEARTHYRKALAADASMADEINAKVVAARTTAAKELLARGKTLQSEGKPHEARRVWSTLVQELPLEPSADEAKKLLAEDTTQRKKQTMSHAAAKPAKRAAGGAAVGADVPLRASGEPFSDATVKRFQPVIESYHKMLDATQEGLVEGGSGGIDKFEKALKEGEKIRKAADKVKADAGADEEVAEALALVDTKLEAAVVDARLNLVDSYMMRTSYNQASEVVREGLAEYPENQHLRQAMNRVTAAAAEGLGGDWVVVGR